MFDNIKPLCDISIVSVICGNSTHSLGSGQAGLTGTGIVLKADFPALEKIQSASLSELMASSAEGSQLSLDIKLAQMATSDLISLVRTSDLTTHDLVADELETFVDIARVTARGLQKLNARVSGAVDHILAANEYALHILESEVSKSPSTSLLQTVWPWPWSLTDAGSDAHRAVLVTTTFQDVMNLFTIQTSRVVLQCECALTKLDRLEEHLHVINDMLSREHMSITGEHSQVLSELWTMLGGNRRRLWNIDQRLDLLRNVGEYRIRALTHVGRTMRLVLAMSENMEELRLRVATPILVEDRIPIEIQLHAIKASIDRIKENRRDARERARKTADEIPLLDGT
ncbi:hypothetical protein QCA50_019422 [Cerrena zonata]|uniref:Uncharacterized protein n=1 Tax=Cerrena zonata TaxID=2478898 RepID=A0AAW0FJV1_9APHY